MAPNFICEDIDFSAWLETDLCMLKEAVVFIYLFVCLFIYLKEKAVALVKCQGL